MSRRRIARVVRRCEGHSFTASGQDELEASLADEDEVDEFVESFKGKLAFSSDVAKEHEFSMMQVPSSADQPHQYVHQMHFEIVSSRIVKGGRDRHVMYSILISQASLDPSPVIVERRYSDFDKLYRKLKKHYPDALQHVPFPKKVLLGNFKSDTIVRRSRAFEQFLTYVAGVDSVSHSQDLEQFFYAGELMDAFNYIHNGRNSDAVTLLEKVVLVQRKLLGDSSKETIATMCALVAVASASEEEDLAFSFAESALKSIGSDTTNDHLVPLLKLAIRLCWKLGKDKQDLEAQLQDLRKNGIDVDNERSLMQVVASPKLSPDDSASVADF